MKKISKILALILVLTMILSLAACGGKKPDEQKDPEPKPEAELTYDEKSKAVYDAALGEFFEIYETAKAAENQSERWALMAVAEAKLMESGVMLPLRSNGGNYAISRVAPYTVDYSLWGSDSDRYHQAIIATEFIKTEHRDEMKAKWGELKGTGTYEDWVKDYLKGKGYTLTDEYKLGYSSDAETWDVLATSKQNDSEKVVQTYDGLMEYDVEGTLQPALAESVEVSADGLTWTFKIRQGVKWVDSQGREIGEVTADDFVAGMQHMMDAMGGLEYLVQGIIVNATEYINQEVLDFNEVGVKAVDTYTLQYTLTAPCSYFDTMLGYSVFAPMNRAYYESKGGKFGAEYQTAAESESYTYGKDKDSIAYCGPYLITNATEKNTIVFEANPTYWNKDNINVKKMVWLFNDGSEATKAYNDAVAGTIAGAGLNSSALELAKGDGNFEKYAYVSSCDATSFMAFHNLNRAVFANANDNTTVVSAQTEEQAKRTNQAMQNVHFRRALCMAVDRGAYNAQSVGEELKLTSLRNCYTPGTFVALKEDVTIDINGTATTFKAGTWYGEIMQAQIDADGVAIKVWDPTGDGGVGSSDAFDGWYNPTEAAKELEKAIQELGIEVTAENPIYIDVPFPSNSESYTNQENAYKQSVEAALGGKVIVNLVSCVDYNEWYYAGYFTSYGYEANYDMYDCSGWGPDYGDPQTYLDTFLPDYAGYMVKCLGIF